MVQPHVSELSRESCTYDTDPIPPGKVAALCVSDSLDLPSIASYYKRQDYRSIITHGVLHVTNRSLHHGSGYRTMVEAEFDLFVFAYGSVVWWGNSHRSFESIARDFLQKTYNHRWVQQRYAQRILEQMFPLWLISEFVSYRADELWTSATFTEALQRDRLLLHNQRSPLKQAFSHSLAQNVKMDVVENLVDRLLQECRPLPYQMKVRGQASISGLRARQLKGEIFQYRMMIRNESELVGEPDFFWEHSRYLPLFEHLNAEYSIAARIHEVDEKLDAAMSTLDTISWQFQQRHATRLEWIVIILIFFEILIASVELGLQFGFGAALYGG